MRRGNIGLVDLEPGRGSEADERRPTVIVSNDGAATTAERLGPGVVTVVPLESNVRRDFPIQVLLLASDTGLPEDSKAQAEQICSVAVQPLGGRVQGMGSAGSTPSNVHEPSPGGR